MYGFTALPLAVRRIARMNVYEALFSYDNSHPEWDASQDICDSCEQPVTGDYSLSSGGNLSCGPCEAEFYGEDGRDYDEDYGDHGPLDSDPYDRDYDVYSS